ncbi:MAG: peptidase [Bacteroidetes bacterium]|nr:peptidase [Bacteroidota bacterium]
MPSRETRRRSRPGMYEIVIVPVGEVGKTRRFRYSALRLWLVGGGVFLLIFVFVLVLLMYTPVAMYIPIRNPELEQKYGRQIAETQDRVNSLAEDVLILRDYNTQLRKALGERGTKGTVASGTLSAYLTEGQATSGAQIDTGGVFVSEPPEVQEFGDYELSGSGFNAVVTSNAGFRAAFPLLSPTEGFVTQGFDPSRKHVGIDYATKTGTPVYAGTDGYIVFSNWSYDDGNMIIIAHGGGYLTVYKHNQVLLKSSNTFVKRGELIALSGSTGKTSLGPHLHFEVWKDGVPQDPNEFLLTPYTIQ